MASTRKSPLRALALIGLCGSALMLAIGIGQASARSLVTHTLSKTINGSEIVEHPNRFEVNSIAVDEHTGTVYVASRYPEITKFKPDGTLSSWSAPELAGATTIQANPYPPPNSNPLTGAKVAVDNTNGPHQGRIYLLTTAGGTYPEIHAYDPSGREVTEATSGENFPITNADVTPAQFGPFNISIDDQGNIWENEENGFFFWREFTAEGERAKVLRSEVAGEGGWGLDSNHDVYLGQYTGTTKYDDDANKLFDVADFSGDIAVDRSTDDAYVIGKTNQTSSRYISQYDVGGNRVAQIDTGSTTFTPRFGSTAARAVSTTAPGRL